MKKLGLLGLLLALLASLVLAPSAAALSAGTNINTIDVSTNINNGSNGCPEENPQSPHADVSTWRVAAQVAHLGSTVHTYSAIQPTLDACWVSLNAGGSFTNGKNIWLNCYTFDSYYGGPGDMWLGVTEYGPSNIAYSTFWAAKFQTATNLAAQVPACTVGPGNIVSPTG